MSDLIQYVKDRENREDILFLAIFTDCAQHIGNIKYESINFDFDLIQLPFSFNWFSLSTPTNILSIS
jgi:hypothetical protein